jgi:hypothetical protein
VTVSLGIGGTDVARVVGVRSRVAVGLGSGEGVAVHADRSTSETTSDAHLRIRFVLLRSGP